MTFQYEGYDKPLTLTVPEVQALYRVVMGWGRKNDKALLGKALDRVGGDVRMSAHRLFSIDDLKRCLPIHRDQCDAKVIITGKHQISWRIEKYGDDFNRCSFPATVVIDDRSFCSRHGGELALARMLDEKDPF